MLDTKQAARCLGVDPRTVTARCARGWMPCEYDERTRKFYVPLSAILDEALSGITLLIGLKARGLEQVSKEQASQHYIRYVVTVLNQQFFFVRPVPAYERKVEQWHCMKAS